MNFRIWLAVAKERFQTGENRFRQMSVLELEDTENKILLKVYKKG